MNDEEASKVMKIRMKEGDFDPRVNGGFVKFLKHLWKYEEMTGSEMVLPTLYTIMPKGNICK